MSPQHPRNGEQMVSRRLVAVVALVLVTPLWACGDDEQPPERKPTASTEAPAAAVAPATLKLTPADGKKKVPISAEIGLHVDGGTVTAVALKDEDGNAVSGSLRDDGTAWVPRKPLKATHGYEATVTAENSAGRRTTATTRFT